MGDSGEYKTENGKIVCNGVVVVRSLQWQVLTTFIAKESTLLFMWVTV